MTVVSGGPPLEPPPAPPPPPPPPPPAAPPPPPRPRRLSPRWAAVIAVIAAVAIAGGGVVLLGQRHTPTFSGSSAGSEPQPPASQEALLADAYQSGRIDRPTWLLYRAYSMFGVDALPQEYSQGDPNTDDNELGEELSRGAPLPQNVKDTLSALLDRPTDPQSAFYGDGPVTTTAADLRSGQAVLTRFGDRCKLNPAAWTAEYTEKYMAPDVPGEAPHGAFKVWTLCTGDWQARLSTAVSLIDSLWGPETALMGNPVWDNTPLEGVAAYGGDSAIDFYLVPRDFPTERLGSEKHTISGHKLAVAVSDAPYIGRASSGFVLLDSARLTNPEFRVDVAHELFHILEYAHSRMATSDIVNGDPQSNWYAEASSVWAQYYFAHDAADNRWAKLARLFLTASSLVPIDARGPKGSILATHTYADFLWLYFMQQEAGPQAIAQAWKALEGADNGAQGTALWDQSFSFDAHFEDFALRNLDQVKYKPALGKVYQDLDAKFPEFAPPVTNTIVVSAPSAAGAAVQPRVLSIDHLTTQYYDVVPDANIKQMTLALALQPAAHSHADLVMHSASAGYTRVSLPVNGQKMVCLDGVDEMKLVVSDGDFQGTATGTLTPTGSSDACNSTPMPRASITFTGLQPSTVTADGQPVMVRAMGSGFSVLKATLSDCLGGRAQSDGSLLTTGPGLTFMCTVVSDSEIDMTVAFESDNTPGLWDVSVGGDIKDSPNGATAYATCNGCLTIVKP